ncbi:MAG: hypothetical protein EXQ70_02930 [Solirubrobacterales bacterium]|nr:hypothetical protein [Solirubrobacterales bacterium]
MDETGAVPVIDMDRSFDAGQPIVLIDASTGERQLIWAEIDSNATTPGNTDLIIRVGKNLTEGHRYIVALRNLKDADGNMIPAPPGFKLYRDSVKTDVPAIEGRRAGFEDIFIKLGDATPGDGVIQGSMLPFSITKIETAHGPSPDLTTRTSASRMRTAPSRTFVRSRVPSRSPAISIRRTVRRARITTWEPMARRNRCRATRSPPTSPATSRSPRSPRAARAATRSPIRFAPRCTATAFSGTPARCTPPTCAPSETTAV